MLKIGSWFKIYEKYLLKVINNIIYKIYINIMFINGNFVNFVCFGVFESLRYFNYVDL